MSFEAPGQVLHESCALFGRRRKCSRRKSSRGTTASRTLTRHCTIFGIRSLGTAASPKIFRPARRSGLRPSIFHLTPASSVASPATRCASFKLNTLPRHVALYHGVRVQFSGENTSSIPCAPLYRGLTRGIVPSGVVSPPRIPSAVSHDGRTFTTEEVHKPMFYGSPQHLRARSF